VRPRLRSWNSEHDSIEQMHALRVPVNETLTLLATKKVKDVPAPFTAAEEKVMWELLQVLAPCKTVVNHLQGGKYCTMGAGLPAIFGLTMKMRGLRTAGGRSTAAAAHAPAHLLSRWVCGSGNVIGAVANEIEAQLLARLAARAANGTNNLLLVVPLLDPCYKDLPGWEDKEKKLAKDYLVRAVADSMAVDDARAAAAAPAAAVRDSKEPIVEVHDSASALDALIAPLPDPVRSGPELEVAAYLSSPLGAERCSI
jgi:hypothetical protein